MARPSAGEAVKEVFLCPGEHFVGDERHRVSTLLGSCVSITLWHARARLGAMSHFLLPSRQTDPGQTLDGRYADEVMELMKVALNAMDVRLSDCVGKIFGGADMFPGQYRASSLHVGLKNGEAARHLLRRHRVPLISEYLFGVGHRQVVFEIDTGYVWSRQLPLSEPLAALERQPS